MVSSAAFSIVGRQPNQQRPARRLGRGVVLGGRYRLEKIIAHGGMSAVYEASDLKNQGNPLVLKIVDDSLNQSALAKESLAFERNVFRTLSEERSPLFPEYYNSDINPASDRLFIAMELIPGRTLKALLTEKERLPLHKVIDITMQLCGLIILHKQGLVHRDLKPSNIIISGQRAVVLDFGIACPNGHRDRGGILTGTLNYLSPEQIMNKPLDTRVDIYALGVILYEMIHGQNPMVGDNTLQTISNHQFRSIPTLDYQAIEKRIRPEARESAESQMLKLHSLLFEIIVKMTPKDRRARIPNLKKILPLLKKARKLARKLAPYESLTEEFPPSFTGNNDPTRPGIF